MKVKNVTILILGIIFIDGLAADDYYIEHKPHTDNYDITVVYKTTSAYNGSGNPFNRFKCPECYDATIHLRTNAIGMPIQFNGKILSSDKKSLEFIADQKYTSNNIFTRNEVEYNADNWAITTYSMFNDVKDENSYNLLLWKADDHTESFKIKWQQRNTVQTCISVSYLLEDVSKCGFEIDLVDEDSPDKRVIFSHDNIRESNELLTVLFKSNNLLNENQSYSLNVKLQKTSEQVIVKIESDSIWGEDIFFNKTVYADKCKIGIKRIAQCKDDSDENEETLVITANDLQITPTTFNVYPFEILDYKPLKKSVLPSSTCLNGGFESKNGCACPPGFRGNHCEHGCGSNAFGVDCTGMCSLRKTHCRQMMICTNDFGCMCPAGFRGDDCSIECTSGTYGVNCEQQCSEGCRSKSCDVYTGVCNNGCAESYITPDCTEKYPWLNSPPQLQQDSSDFTSLKLKIDLNSENINGNTNINPEYYQIIFKDAQSKSEFQYSEFKEIGQQKSVLETIDNLQPGLLYSFGAILVLEDGNYNIEDAKMANYSTKCILSSFTSNHDVNLLGAADHINITWHKLHRGDQHDNECKITDYLLKLMHNNTTIEEHSYSAIGKSFDNSYQYMFKNLVSGEKYTVHFTGKLSTGAEIPSKTSYTYTTHHGFVQIKNIKAKLHQNSLLTVTWEIDERHKNTPLSYTIKYKVNKHFSCSHKVVTSNWTSLSVYNQTKCDLVDLTPNTQYIIKVDPTFEGYDYRDQANIIFVKTNVSTPKLIPVYDSGPYYLTSRSAYLNWTINITECSKLNGFFRGYHVVLESVAVNGTKVAKSTKQNNVNFDELIPGTEYKLWVYVETNYGFNPDQGLLIQFKTKSEISVPVNLTVYKRDLDHKSIGIRWSYPDENIVTFIVYAIDKSIKGSTRQNITVEPIRCKAWPKFYCTNVDKLTPNHLYTIEVKATSKDDPAGGLTASVESKFTDGLPDKPKNLISTFVNSTSVTLKWDIPWTFGGVLQLFIVNIEEISSIDDMCCDVRPDQEISVNEETSTYSCVINGLKLGSKYSIGVSSSKLKSYDESNMIYVTTLLNDAVTPTTPPETTTNSQSPINSTKL